jgi:hypothetical protein
LKYPNCPECTRLWSAYAKATNDFFRLDGKLQVAGLSHDHEAVKELLPVIEKVAAERTDTRNQIATHELKAHPATEAAKA